MIHDYTKWNRGKDTCKQGKRYVLTGRKVRGNSIRAGARMNKGGRPYILGRPP